VLAADGSGVDVAWFARAGRSGARVVPASGEEDGADVLFQSIAQLSVVDRELPDDFS